MKTEPITQEDVDKAWDKAWNKAWDRAWDEAREAWDEAVELEKKFKEQESN